jgi:hypothetical protein
MSKLRIAVVGEQGQFRDPDKGEARPLEAVSRGLVKAVTGDTSICGFIIFYLQFKSAIRIYIL